MGTLPFRTIGPTRPILGNGGGRNDILQSILGQLGGGGGGLMGGARGGLFGGGGYQELPGGGAGIPGTPGGMMGGGGIVAGGPSGGYQGGGGGPFGGGIIAGGPNGMHRAPVGYGRNGHPFYNLEQFNEHNGQRHPHWQGAPAPRPPFRGGHPEQPRSFREALIQRALMGQLGG